MPKCIDCGAETELHVSGVPVCIACDAKMQYTRPAPNAYASVEEESPRTETKDSESSTR